MVHGENDTRVIDGDEPIEPIWKQFAPMLGAGVIPKSMKKAGVSEVEEVRVHHGLGLERVRLPAT